MISRPNAVQYILDLPMDTIPGTKWHYSTGASHLFSAILTRANGKSTLDFANENLFGPLGIHEFNWEKDPQGNVWGGSALWLKPKDLARVGQLMLNNGIWEGNEIIPESWVKNFNRYHR